MYDGNTYIILFRNIVCHMSLIMAKIRKDIIHKIIHFQHLFDTFFYMA